MDRMREASHVEHALKVPGGPVRVPLWNEVPETIPSMVFEYYILALELDPLVL